MILDAGVFIALDNPAQRRKVVELVRRLLANGEQAATNEAALAQVWRDPATQVPLIMLIRAVTVHPFGDARAIGRRCGASGSSDVVDASLAVLADELVETILTTDPDDMRQLGARYETL